MVDIMKMFDKIARPIVLKAKLALEVKEAAEDKEADEFELVGVRCRVIREDYVNIFGIPGEVAKELADIVLFKVDGEQG